MSEISQLSTRIDRLAARVERLAAELESFCHGGTTAGVASPPRTDLSELEAVKAEAETIKRELAAMKYKSKLDPEVRTLETRLDEVLSRYYWLWQKCKDNMA